MNLRDWCIWLVDLFEYNFTQLELPLSIIRSFFFTVHTAVVYVIQVYLLLASRIGIFHVDPSRKQSANLYVIYHCCVYREKTPDVGQRNCPKHVEFHSKNKFVKLMQLVLF